MIGFVIQSFLQRLDPCIAQHNTTQHNVSGREHAFVISVFFVISFQLIQSDN